MTSKSENKSRETTWVVCQEKTQKRVQRWRPGSVSLLDSDNLRPTSPGCLLVCFLGTRGWQLTDCSRQTSLSILALGLRRWTRQPSACQASSKENEFSRIYKIPVLERWERSVQPASQPAQPNQRTPGSVRHPQKHTPTEPHLHTSTPPHTWEWT